SDALLAYLAEFLPDYMVPAQLVQLERLPLTANGKLDRSALPAPEASAAAPPPEAAAANDTEQKLVAIWQEVLRVPHVGVSDDFFKLGGDSILSLQIVARARRRGLKVTPQQLFECKTVRELARVAKELPAKTATATIAPSSTPPRAAESV